MRIQVIVAIAPVRQRHVVVDADEVDIRVGPKRVQMKEQLAIARMMSEIFGPVRRIANLDTRAQDCPNIGRQPTQRLDGWVAVLGSPDAGHGNHLGPDQEGVGISGNRAQMRVMQDETAIGPFLGADIDDAVTKAVKIVDLCLAKELRHFVDSSLGHVRSTRQARGNACGHAATPWHDRLFAIAIGIRQVVAGKLLHQNERIKDRLPSRRRQRPQSFDHGPVGGRPAIDGASFLARDLLRGRATNAACVPRHLVAIDFPELDLWLDRAMSDPQIAAKPGYDHGHRTHIRKFTTQDIQ